MERYSMAGDGEERSYGEWADRLGGANDMMFAGPCCAKMKQCFSWGEDRTVDRAGDTVGPVRVRWAVGQREPFARRKLLLTILLAVMSVVAVAHAGKPPISVSIAVPEGSGERRIDDRDRTTHFHVIVSNSSEKTQRIGQEWCSWGYFGLTFELTDERGKKWVAKKKPRDWTRNFPAWWTLRPHESLVLDVHLGDADTWEGFPRPEHGSQTVTMQAVFEFKPDDESRTHAVWTGRIVSKAGTFVFYHWRPEAN